jgi:hypothetical protein
MGVRLATAAFLFDVGHFAICREFAVTANDAAALKSSETKQPNEAHNALLMAMDLQDSRLLKHQRQFA